MASGEAMGRSAQLGQRDQQLEIGKVERKGVSWSGVRLTHIEA